MQFIVRNVPAIGNCLFEAVGRSIDVSASDLRQRTVEWMMIPNQTLFGDSFQTWLGDVSVEKYSNSMSKNGTWGGGIELAIIAKLIHRPIVVFASNSSELNTAKRIAEFIPDLDSSIPTKKEELDNLSTVCVLYVGGSHYMQIEIK